MNAEPDLLRLCNQDWLQVLVPEAATGSDYFQDIVFEIPSGAVQVCGQATMLVDHTDIFGLDVFPHEREKWWPNLPDGKGKWTARSISDEWHEQKSPVCCLLKAPRQVRFFTSEEFAQAAPKEGRNILWRCVGIEFFNQSDAQARVLITAEQCNISYSVGNDCDARIKNWLVLYDPFQSQ